MKLSPLDSRPSAVDQCADRVRDAILSGALAPGERLPAERTLAESLGVGRVTVRSALARLQAARLLSVRQGSGYVVQDYTVQGGPDLLGSLAHLAERPTDQLGLAADVLLMRRHMARAVLERLAQHDDPKAQSRVAEAVDAFVGVAEAGADIDAVMAADLTVLRALLTATGSPVLQLCFNPVLRVLHQLPVLRRAMYAVPEENAAAYQSLVRFLAHPSDVKAAAIDAVSDLLAARDQTTLGRLEALLTAEVLR